MIVNDDQRATMEFIATVNRGGYRPTGDEVNEWRTNPDPIPEQRGELLEPEIPAVPSRRVRKGPAPFGSLVYGTHLAQFARNQGLLGSLGSNFALPMPGIMHATRFANLYSGYETIPGKPGRPAKYGPAVPAEEFLDSLCRLEWIERNDGGQYGVTLLGNALLRAEASAETDAEDSPVTVLEAGDELAYGHLLGVIAECGSALIIDGYLRAQQLVHILKHTNASRFLVGTKLNEKYRVELAALINLTPPNADGAARELRCADLHDRYVIGDHEVYGLGSSLNGVGGKNTTTLIKMPDVAATSIRAEATRLWNNAKVIARTEQDDNAKDSHEEVVYRHDGCAIKHRSQHTADNCKNGR